MLMRHSWRKLIGYCLGEVLNESYHGDGSSCVMPSIDAPPWDHFRMQIFLDLWLAEPLYVHEND